jgi:hypothetical protein
VSDEFKSVKNDFVTKLEREPSKFELQRVENKYLYAAFVLHKEKLTKQNVGKCNEMNLFHGTKPSSVDNIAKFGFNRSYCGVNGVSLGHGVYFAVNSSYSDSYAQAPSGNMKKMFRTKVLVGESCAGNSSMRTPPPKPNGILYDSTDNGSGSVFVCYHDNQCYPDYIISYC